jgi:DNA polymerase-4
MQLNAEQPRPLWPRTIIHLDMDAFYASVEVLDRPELRGRPVVVGGASDRSVVSAASYEARKYGIHSAMPMVQARRLCPDGVFLPVRMGRYRELSDRIMAIFARFTPLFEPISLDEAFLDVTGSARLFGTGVEIAAAVKRLIREETGLTGSAGVATSKLLAKIASDLQKPDGLTVVAPGREGEFLAPLPIAKLWGVGQATRKELSLLGVTTIGDLARLPVEILSARFGKGGLRMHLAARGLDDRPVVPEREAKSVGHEETFAEDLRDQAKMRAILLDLAGQVGSRLRRYNLRGRTITLKVKFHDFKLISRSATLDEATDDALTIFRRTRELLQQTEAGRRAVRLLGISLGNLTSSSSPRQNDLFGAGVRQARRAELNRAMDEINRRYGREAISPALLTPKKNPARNK